MGLAAGCEVGEGETSATVEALSRCGLIISARVTTNTTHTIKAKTNLGLTGLDDKQKIRDRQEPVPDWGFPELD
jgi:hypothetical protein